MCSSELSYSEVEELVTPHENTIKIVDDWLTSHGVDPQKDVERNSAGDWLTVKLPLSRVEKMLSTKYHIYKRVQTEELVVRTLSYSLPRGLHDHIDLIQPTTMFDRMRRMDSTIKSVEQGASINDISEFPFVLGPAGQNISASCNRTITPTCLMQLYRTEGFVPSAANKGNRIGVTGFLEQVRTVSQSLLSLHDFLQFVNFADLQVNNRKTICFTLIDAFSLCRRRPSSPCFDRTLWGRTSP